jgi:hypothetical protein
MQGSIGNGARSCLRSLPCIPATNCKSLCRLIFGWNLVCRVPQSLALTDYSDEEATTVWRVSPQVFGIRVGIGSCCRGQWSQWGWLGPKAWGRWRRTQPIQSWSQVRYARSLTPWFPQELHTKARTEVGNPLIEDRLLIIGALMRPAIAISDLDPLEIIEKNVLRPHVSDFDSSRVEDMCSFT